MLIALPILALGFLSPLLFAAGAAAVSIPIIIHLLNKRKFRVVIWAAMEFLLAAQRRNARRLKFQRWLLLALRCLAILILAAGIAQLVLNSGAFAQIFGGQRIIVVIWDDSYSMGWQHPGAPSAFDKSKKLLADWLDSLAPADKVLLIRASRGAPELAAGSKPTFDHQTLAAAVRRATLTDGSTDVAGACDIAAAALKDTQSTSGDRAVYILTDFSTSSIRQNKEAASTATSEDHLKKSLAALSSHATTLRLFDLGDPAQSNVGIAALTSVRPIVVANVPSDFEITVMNGTSTPQVGLPITLAVDGLAGHSEKLGRIDPGGIEKIQLKALVSSPGRHYIEARLPPDLLPVHDIRRLMLDVPRDIQVLLVDGSPGDGKTSQGSITYLWAAYGLPVDGKFGGVFAPRRITELELPTTPLAPFSEVVLSDTAVPAPAVREALQKFVNDGGLLLIFPGNRTNTTLTNQAFSALLPATLGQPVRIENSTDMSQQGGGVPFAPEGFTNPVLAQFGDASRDGKDVGFLSVQTSQYLKLGVPQDGSVETILRYAKSDGSPGDAAVVAKAVGKGKVVLFASSADTSWNTFGAKPSFLPFIYELTYHTLARRQDNATLRVGDRINLPTDIANPGTWSGPRNTHITVTTELGQNNQTHLTSDPLTMAGLYIPSDAAAAGKPAAVVNPDPEEIDIRHLAASQMASALALDPKQITIQPTALETKIDTLAAGQHGSDLARYLILGALVFFLTETLFARLFSVYR